MVSERESTLTTIVEHDAGAVHLGNQRHSVLEVVGLAATGETRQEKDHRRFLLFVEPV